MTNLYPEWHNKPLKLTTEELQSPASVLTDFFETYRLVDLREALHEILSDALHHKESNALNHTSLCRDLERLAEASWLILEEHNIKSLATEQRPAIGEEIKPLPPEMHKAFASFVEYHPAKRFRENLRRMLLEYLMYDGATESIYLYDTLNDLNGLFDLLEIIEEHQPKYKRKST